MRNKEKVIFTILISFLFIFTISAVSADDYTINDTSTGGIRQGITNTGIGDTLFLEPGIYDKLGNDTSITINKNITIQGKGPKDSVKIDANNLNKIFTIANNVNVTFINVTFLRGNSSDDGGAITSGYSTSTMNFINCSFINCSSINRGGAIYSVNHNVKIIDCIFENNSARRGGAIYNTRDNLTINGTTFNNNFVQGSSDSQGGAIFNLNGANVTVINSIFNNNFIKQGGTGGAIHNQNGPNFTVKGSDFNNNSAISGGAISVYGDGVINLNIEDSNFINNRATNSSSASGGAISIAQIGLNPFYITRCNFTNNNAVYGGVVYTDSGILFLNDSRLESNNASYGGALTISLDVYVYNSTFIKNNASYGGAIYPGRILNINMSNFEDNTAYYGGAIFKSSYDMTVINSNFTNNEAIYNSISNVGGIGGAIVNYGGNANVTGSIFTNNKADYGAGIYNRGNMFVSSNIMENNVAGIQGNEIYNDGTIGNLNLTYINNSTIITNNGSIVSLYATLTDDMGNTITGQNISFYVNGILIGSLESIEGYANLTYVVDGSMGDLFLVNGTYDGIGSYSIIIKKGLLRIGKIKTNSTINAGNDEVGKPITITGILTDENGNALANIQLNITIEGNIYTVTTNNEGEWSLTYTPTYANAIEVQVSYAGNDTYEGFINITNFQAFNPTPIDDSNNTDNETNNNPEINNTDNQTSNNNNNHSKAKMQSTGMPILAILVVLLGAIGSVYRKK